MKNEKYTHDVTSADLRLHQKRGRQALLLEIAGDYTAAGVADSASFLNASPTVFECGFLHLGVIIEGPGIGRRKNYKLNPHIGWKRSVSNHKKALIHGLSVIDGGIK